MSNSIFLSYLLQDFSWHAVVEDKTECDEAAGYNDEEVSMRC